jgi:hypothetical protein
MTRGRKRGWGVGAGVGAGREQAKSTGMPPNQKVNKDKEALLKGKAQYS